MTTDLDKAVERLRDVLAGRDRGLVRPARSDDLRAILDEYDRRGAALVEAAKAIEALQADNERLRAGLVRARDDMEGWAAYADEYFREKHRLEDDLAAIDAVLTTTSTKGVTAASTPPEGEG